MEVELFFRYTDSSGYAKKINVWDVVSGQLLRSLEGHTRNVTSVAISSDGQQIVSGSEDWSIKVWDMESGQLLRSIDGVDDPQAIAVTPDGRMIVCGCMDKTVKVPRFRKWEVAMVNGRAYR